MRGERVVRAPRTVESKSLWFDISQTPPTQPFCAIERLRDVTDLQRIHRMDGAAPR